MTHDVLRQNETMATDLLDRVQCPTFTLNPPLKTPAGTFTVSRL